MDNKIEKGFRNSLISDNTKSITKDVLEANIDFLLDNEIIKGIPLVKIGVEFLKLPNKLQSYFLTKKILLFLNEIDMVTDKEKSDFINKLNSNSKYNKDFGERTLIIIDSLDDTDKAKLIGKACKFLIIDKINIDDFLKISYIINRAFISDLEVTPDFPDISESQKEYLYSIGILTVNRQKIINGMQMKDVRDILNDLSYCLSEIGYKLIDIILS